MYVYAYTGIVDILLLSLGQYPYARQQKFRYYLFVASPPIIVFSPTTATQLYDGMDLSLTPASETELQIPRLAIHI